MLFYESQNYPIERFTSECIQTSNRDYSSTGGKFNHSRMKSGVLPVKSAVMASRDDIEFRRLVASCPIMLP